MLHDERSREEVRRLEDDFFDWFETADAEKLEDGTLDGFLEELERVDPLPGGSSRWRRWRRCWPPW